MTTKRVNETALRVLRVLIALKGHTLTGLSNGEVAKALGESPANITRYMQTLIEAGLVERREDVPIRSQHQHAADRPGPCGPRQPHAEPHQRTQPPGRCRLHDLRGYPWDVLPPNRNPQ